MPRPSGGTCILAKVSLGHTVGLEESGHRKTSLLGETYLAYSHESSNMMYLETTHDFTAVNAHHSSIARPGLGKRKKGLEHTHRAKRYEAQRILTAQIAQAVHGAHCNLEARTRVSEARRSNKQKSVGHMTSAIAARQKTTVAPRRVR